MKLTLASSRPSLRRERQLADVFKPELAGAVLYVKLILRSDCIVVSFHDDAGGHDEDA